MGDTDLFEPGEDQEGAPSPFADAAGMAPGRRIGRPKGARNKHSEAFETYYYSKGYRDPLVAAAEVVSTDPVELLAWFKHHDKKGSKGLTLKAIVELQMAAGRDVAPYLHGKAPVRVQIEGGALPMLVINAATNQLAQGMKLLEGKGRTIGRPADPEPSIINGLGEGETGESHDPQSHEDE